jgi:hypothetical protein
MREQLNSNPMVQLAVVAVLLVVGGIFLLTMMGGGGEESEGGEATATAPGATAVPGNPVEGSVESLEAESSVSVSEVPAPPIEPPAQVVDAWDSGATVVLLFVRDGGIDDRLARSATQGLSDLSNVTSFVVPAKSIARYSALTSGIGIDRVPALVVLTPKDVGAGMPTASVHYGYQSPESVVQAVVDAGYEGPTLDYHP